MRLITVFVMTAFLVFFLTLSDKTARINEGVLNVKADLKPEPEKIPTSKGNRDMCCEGIR